MSYSSDLFNQDWRFRIDKDFLKSSGEAYEYADHGLQEWGDEFLNIPFSSDGPSHGSKCAAISDDGRYIAINNSADIYVFEITGSQHIYTLQGHVSQVDTIVFRPGHPHQLVSSAQQNRAGAVQTGPEVIFWDLKRVADHKNFDDQDIERVSRNAANAVIAELKASPVSFDLTAGDQKSLAQSMVAPIGQLVRRKSQAPSAKLSGRLATGFQAELFSRSGKLMHYMPGKAPNSNGDDNWELRLATFETPEDYILLSGNRDSIMWAGFNHDESMIGTACWDGSFRIWDTKRGHQKYVWETGTQNWTAGFSPDSKFFAGTSGDGNLHMYNLLDGSKHMTFETNASWVRSLSWHPTKPLLAFGGRNRGTLSLIDVNEKKAIQVRMLSTEAMKAPPGREIPPRIGNSFLEVVGTRFVDNGRKIAFMTSGDGSAEVYDIHDEVKWRFARAGTMNAPDDDSPVTSKSGYGMRVHEDYIGKKVVVLTIDGDAVRLWRVPMSS